VVLIRFVWARVCLFGLRKLLSAFTRRVDFETIIQES